MLALGAAVWIGQRDDAGAAQSVDDSPQVEVASEPPAAPEAAEADIAPAPDPVTPPVVVEVEPAETVAPVAAVDTVAATVAEGTSRFVPTATLRVLDTRGIDAPAPDTELSFEVPPSASVALSVSIVDTERSGAVVFDGRDGTVEALRLPGAGATTTNLAIVPVDGDRVSVRSSAGGHLVVDLVGIFETVDGPVASGRFVPVADTRIGRLVTSDDGRELLLPLSGQRWTADATYDSEGGNQPDQTTYDLTAASAVLAVVSADVGSEGGVVRLGPEHDRYEQMLMWAPASGQNKVRHGLVLLTPDDVRLGALRYDGGSELTFDVVGYFTGDDAEVADTGLLLPDSATTLGSTPVFADSGTTLGGFAPEATGAIVSLNPLAGIPGRLGARVMATNGGSGSIWTDDDVEVIVTVFAQFS